MITLFVRWFAALPIGVVGSNSLMLGMVLVAFAWAGDVPWWVVFCGFTVPIIGHVAVSVHTRNRF